MARASGVALALFGALAGVRPAHAQAPANAAELVNAARVGKPLWATLQTSSGTIVIQLDTAASPQSSATFVGYATGTLMWKDKGKAVQKPLYDGTTFHRTIPGFLIQGGDPSGTGTGGPGQATPDDTAAPTQKALHFVRGAVGLAHVPDASANGSQFFILVGDAPWLDGRYTQIGHVISGQQVADAIANAPRGPQDRPLQPVTLQSVRISDKAPRGGSRKK